MDVRATLDRLFRAYGLKVEQVPAPQMPDGDDVFLDKEADVTVFTVNAGGEKLYFSIAGADEKSRITAALAREIISSAQVKVPHVDPVRAFLEGTGDIPPGVRVGKSEYYVFALYGGERCASVFDYLSAMSSSNDFVADVGDGIIAFVKEVRNDDDYRSAGEFALVLRENLYEDDKPVKVGVGGTAHGIADLPLFFGYAKSALVYGAEFDPKSEIYSYKDYALIKALSELPIGVMDKFVRTVLDKNYREVLSDEELMTAADAFIKHSLNISEASRSMYVHRNTLIYRLDKIEKATGLDIRNFNDAMTFRAAYLMSKLI